MKKDSTHIIFDLDGTLIDTQIIHQKIESNFISKYGINIDAKIIGLTYAGRSPIEWIPELLNENKVKFNINDINNFIGKKDKEVITLLNQGKIKLFDGTLSLLSNLKNDGYKIGISSGACRDFIDSFLVYYNLNEIIEVSTSANEVKNKKPHPDVFQESFNKLEKKYGIPNNKIVIGDGWSDIQGGKDCDAKTIWINKNKPKNLDILDCQVNSISEIYEKLKK